MRLEVPLMLRIALRTFVRTPLFTSAIVGTLALGLGVNSALFSLAYTLLLAPLPYSEPGRLVAVWETVKRETVEQREFSFPNFRDLAAEAKSFEHLAAWADDGFTLTGLERAERVQGERVSGAYFRTLGLEPALGRFFDLESSDLSTAPLEVVLSEGAWRRRFGARVDVLGSSLTVDGQPMTIVGVAAPGFAGLSQGAEIWVPVGTTPGNFMENRASRWFSVVGRLAPGASVASAKAETRSILDRLAAANPGDSQGYSGTLLDLRQDLLGSFRRPMLLLLGAVGLVLLIACANVANLLMIRTIGRRREAAVQLALGASRRNRLLQTLIESLLPSLAAGALGLLLASAGLSALFRFGVLELPSLVVPSLDPTSLGGTTLLFSAALAVLMGLVLGLMADLGRDTTALSEALRAGGRGESRTRLGQRTRQSLVVLEVACALVVSIGAGLLLKSLHKLNEVDPGFDAGGLLTLSLDLSAAGEEAQRRALATAVLDRVSQLPGVVGATASSDLPLGNDWSATTVRPENFTPRADEPYEGRTRIHTHQVHPSFFATLGIRLAAGRAFTATDLTDASRPVIVSQTLARRLWPGEDALGKRLSGRSGNDGPWFTVIAVAEDVRYRTLVPGQTRLEDPDLYRPLDLSAPNLQLAVRSSLPAATLGPMLRGEIERLSRGVALFDSSTMSARRSAQLASARLNTLLLGLFALLALLLAAVGIFSVLTHLVGQRKREIGVRLALGASKREVVIELSREAVALVGLGMAMGLTTAVLCARLLASQLYAVPATDPQILAMAVLLLASLAAVACLLPMKKALAVDPAISLRSE